MENGESAVPWTQLGRRWWLDAALRLVTLVGFAVCYVTFAEAVIPPPQPKWLTYVLVLPVFLMGILLWPQRPRPDEEPIRIRDAFLALGILCAVLVGGVVGIAVVIAGWSILNEFFANLFRDASITTFLLFIIIALLFGIYERLGQRR